MSNVKKHLDALTDVVLILIHDKIVQKYKEIDELKTQIDNYFQFDNKSNEKLEELQKMYNSYMKSYNHLLTFNNN